MIMSKKKLSWGGGNPKHPQALKRSRSASSPGTCDGREVKMTDNMGRGQSWARRRKKPGIGVWDRSVGLRGGGVEGDDENGSNSSVEVMESSGSVSIDEEIRPGSSDTVVSRAPSREEHFSWASKYLDTRTPLLSERDFPALPMGRRETSGVRVFPRHLVIQSPDLVRQGVFVRGKLIQQALGADNLTGVRIKVVTPPGKEEKVLEVTVANERQANCLLRVKKMGEYPVQVIKHSTRNQVKGVFYDKEEVLKDLSLDAVTLGVRECNGDVEVVKVEKLGKVGHMYKVILECQDMPRRITVGVGLAYPLDVFVPPPMRCFKCQEYGHYARSCRPRTPHRCQRCGVAYDGGHDYDKCKANNCDSAHCFKKCTQKASCVNCKGEHASGDKTCPEQVFQKEKARLHYRQQMPWKQAEMAAMAQLKGQNYATQVVAPTTGAVMKASTTSREAETNIGKRLDTLEEMFKAFMATSAQRESGVNTVPSMAEATAAVGSEEGSEPMRALQVTVETLRADMEQMKKSFEEKARVGYEQNERLRKDNASLKAENDSLQEKIRQMTLENNKQKAVNNNNNQKGGKGKRKKSSSPVSANKVAASNTDSKKPKALTFRDSSNSGDVKVVSQSQPVISKPAWTGGAKGGAEKEGGRPH